MAGLIIIIILSIIIITMVTVYDNRWNGWQRFIIRKGRHRSIRLNRPIPIPYKVSLHFGTLRFKAFFSQGFDYDHDNEMSGDDEDINKLYGLCFGFRPHKNSVRIGWRFNANLKVIEIFLYSYINGKRDIRKLFNIAGYHHEISIVMFQNRDGSVIVEARPMFGKAVTEVVDGIKRSWIKFKLWPYFGGNRTAPENIHIFIR